MGFLRKTILISTGGVAPIKANSKKERIAKAAEKQVRLQQQMLKQQQAPAAAQPVPSQRVSRPAGGPDVVVIRGVDPRRKVAAIQVVYDAVGLPLRDAKRIVDTLEPIECADGAEAAELKDRLEQVGATAELSYSGDISVVDASARQSGVADELERLADLHGTGALSDDEFAAAKRKVIGG